MHHAGLCMASARMMHSGSMTCVSRVHPDDRARMISEVERAHKRPGCHFKESFALSFAER